MSTGALVLAAVLGFLCILVVARPFLRSADVDDALAALDAFAALDADQRDHLELLETRDRALTALQELEIDHREGKVNDADYRLLVSQLRAEAAQAMAAIDAAQGGDSVESPVAEQRDDAD